MYKCKYCEKEFDTKYQLAGHVTHCKLNPNYERNKETTNNIKNSTKKRSDKQKYICRWCGKELYTTKSGLTFHENRCIKNPNRKIHPGNRGHCSHVAWNKGLTALDSEIIKNSAIKRRKKYESGELQGSFKGHKHTERTKRKLRNITINQIKKLGPVRCNYSKKGCKLMNELNIQNNWNLQHAENGGEFYVDGYWLDGYDKNLNIAFEYDEPKHYLDVLNNIQSDKDIERQTNIIKALNCEFWRYNEYLNKLYKVSLDS